MYGLSLTFGKDAEARAAYAAPRGIHRGRGISCVQIASIALIVALVAVTGCGPDSGSTTSDPPQDSTATDAAQRPTGPLPGQWLSRMIAAYQSADTYSDRGTLRLRHKQGDRWVEETADFSVVFERPNRLLLKAHRATVNCDGGEFRARLDDERSNHLDGQVVVRPAPETLTLGHLYEEGDQVDPVLAESLAGDLGVVPVQLNLLLGDEPLVELLDPAPPSSSLADDEIDSHPCARVVVRTKSGDLVFWIDKKSYVLRRLEYPSSRSAAGAADDQAAGVAEGVADGAAEGVDQPEFELIADMVDARLNPPIKDATFAWQMSESAKRVRFFVPTPAPLPTKLFGKRVGSFWFSDLKGDRVEDSELAGKIAVLVWYQDHPVCEQALKQLQQVYNKRAGDERLVFRVVSVDTPQLSHQDVQNVLDRWGVTVPAVRDVHPCGPDVFEIKEAPSLVILDGDGVLQYYEVGANPDLVEQLSGVLNRLLRGEALADEILAIQKQEEQTYADQLELAMGEQPSTVMPLTEADLAAKSEPQQFRLLPMWRCHKLQAPGNILAVDAGDRGQRFFVLDGWQSVAEIDARGELAAVHRLPLPDETAISRLRSAVDGEGHRWFAGFEVHGRQVFLFDEKWELVAEYPHADQPHDGLADVQLADLAGDGKVQLFVGFWGAAGVHGVSLAGRPLWRSRDISSVVSLAISWPDEVGTRRLLVTSDQGQILPVNRFGNAYPRMRVGGWAIHGLATAEFASPAAATYCGTSFESGGRRVMVAINREMDDAWSYPLPSGVFQTQVETVCSARLLPDKPGLWVFAAADGSVHLVSEDGQFADQFGHGRHITGLAAIKMGEKGVLVIAGREGPVDCYQVGPK